MWNLVKNCQYLFGVNFWFNRRLVPMGVFGLLFFVNYLEFVCLEVNFWRFSVAGVKIGKIAVDIVLPEEAAISANWCYVVSSWEPLYLQGSSFVD